MENILFGRFSGLHSYALFDKYLHLALALRIYSHFCRSECAIVVAQL